MSSLQEKEELYEKVARLEAASVPHMQIAKAVGLSPGRITQILKEDLCQRYLQEAVEENLEFAQTVNDGWDGVESTALVTVLKHLKVTSDPKFALQAAVMANKATRKGRAGDRVIDGRDGATSVIVLNAPFMQRLEQYVMGADNAVKVIENGEQKEADFMNPTEVETVFSMDKREKSDYDIGKLLGLTG